jgi:hypothetical protein
MAINTLFFEDEMVGRAIGTGKAAQKTWLGNSLVRELNLHLRVPACHPWAWIASATK